MCAVFVFWKTFPGWWFFKYLKINKIKIIYKNFIIPLINFVIQKYHINFARILPLWAILTL